MPERRDRRDFRYDITGILSAAALMVFLTACVVYEPAPAYVSVYDRAWDSALRAAQDSGIVVTSSDRGAGTVRGTKDGIDANIVLRRQADGRTRVESNFSGQLDRDPTLSRRFDTAYEPTWAASLIHRLMAR